MHSININIKNNLLNKAVFRLKSFSCFQSVNNVPKHLSIFHWPEHVFYVFQSIQSLLFLYSEWINAVYLCIKLSFILDTFFFHPNSLWYNKNHISGWFQKLAISFGTSLFGEDCQWVIIFRREEFSNTFPLLSWQTFCQTNVQSTEPKSMWY